MFKTQPFYRVACDYCGVEHEGYEYDWWWDKGMAVEDAADDDWQEYTDRQGVCHHRCPDHWTLTCTHCGKTMDSIPFDKITGWEYAHDSDNMTCPDCSMTLEEPAC